MLLFPFFLSSFPLLMQLSCFEKCNVSELEQALTEENIDLVSTLERSCSLESEVIDSRNFPMG